MELVVDTSVLVAVVTSEAERVQLIGRTRGAELIAPPSVHWEVGNAFAAMLKRRRVHLHQVRQALAAYEQIPVRFIDVDLAAALHLAAEHNIYAYDAYVIACAQTRRCGLLTLDRGLAKAAKAAKVAVMEVV